MAISSAATNLLGALLPEWHLLLQGWSADGRLTAAAQEALILNGEPQALTDLTTQWSAGEFGGLPPIVLLSAADINGAMGAYAIDTGTIYLNADWLAGATKEQVLAVLTEELGHYLDCKLNQKDTQGDEGEYFSDLLRGVVLTDSQKAGLRAESDAGTITEGGKTIGAEFSATTPVIRANSLYTLKDGVTWHQGETYANSIGGHLASINDTEENTFLQTTFQRGWVGYTDELKEGVWLWTDGSTSTYTNWQVGQPDDARGIQDYAQVWDSSGKWDDAEDDTTNSAIFFNKRAIIEIPLSYFSVSDITVTEGSSGSITISRTGGTATSQNLTLTTSNGTATSGSDYNSINTTVSFAAGETSKIIAISTTDDSSVESTETINVSLGASGADTVPAQISKGSAVVTITDNDITPTYTLTPSATTINEGSILTTAVATTNVKSGTTLYYALNGDGITTDDFSLGGLTGSAKVNNIGGFSFAHTIKSDLKTEGTESISIKLYSDSARTLQVGSTATVSINDTSLTPIITYTLTPSATTINEGSILTTAVATTNVKSGTTLYYALNGDGITTDDFSLGGLTGSAKVNNIGGFSFAHTIKSDLKTEGTESISIKLYSDSARTLQVGSTATVSINDTSLQINFTGTINNDVLVGNSANNTIKGLGGADTLTGSEGADSFVYALADSRLAAYDHITDFAIGTDRIDAPNALSAANLRELGAVSALTQAGIAAVLTTATFVRNGAATFSFGTGSSTRTFLALNDGIAGYSSTADGLIEITGFTGALTNLALI